MAQQNIKYDQPTSTPVPKVVAVGTAGAVVAGIVALLALFGVIIPDDLGSQAESAIKALFIIIAAIQAIIQFAAGYLKHDQKAAQVVETIQAVNAQELRG